ncbi:hypothetical protein RRG08_049045 [Elysia crispata]|uniref:Uncharacterized protein n=1 Tax=Elysia crispata TaxID=231223 RepID=A0AAE0YS17_9GAST|nr:hypothetical protein RRG08_049045 [Elysia crispata]
MMVVVARNKEEEEEEEEEEEGEDNLARIKSIGETPGLQKIRSFPSRSAEVDDTDRRVHLIAALSTQYTSRQEVFGFTLQTRIAGSPQLGCGSFY